MKGVNTKPLCCNYWQRVNPPLKQYDKSRRWHIVHPIEFGRRCDAQLLCIEVTFDTFFDIKKHGITDPVYIDLFRFMTEVFLVAVDLYLIKYTWLMRLSEVPPLFSSKIDSLPQSRLSEKI